MQILRERYDVSKLSLAGYVVGRLRRMSSRCYIIFEIVELITN